MLTTEFLHPNKFYEYAHWLKAMDPQTIHNYFGFAISHEAIDDLVKQFVANPRENHFLIAKKGVHWVGTIHIATHGKEVEFGVIVAIQHRKEGIADLMMDEAITWARNRFYTDLYMHCLSWNQPIQRLCKKHGLKPRNMMGDSEAKLVLHPPTPFTYIKEQMFIAQRNWNQMSRFAQFGY
jgi:RimJ/RimL family protein N-acetyltransferase